MSHAASNYVKHLKVAPNGEKIGPSEKSVLLLMADDHHEDLTVAWSSVRALAARACMTTRHCRRIMREIERKGIIETMPNTREKDGGQTSNEYRFCQIDPPFSAQSKATMARRMQLQKVSRMRGPVQQNMFKPVAPPDTDVRGGRTPMSEGGGHRSQGGEDTDVRGGRTPKSGGEDTDVRGGRTPMSAHELLKEPLKTSEGEALLDPKDSPLPPSGAKKTTDDERWSNFKTALKSELYSISAQLAAKKKFSEISSGENDFNASFRDWWLVEAKRLKHGLLLRTMAEDVDATDAGLTKYKGRLERLARLHFGWPANKPVNFVLLRDARPATIPQLAAVAAIAPDPRDDWEKVKAELVYRISCLEKHQSAEAMTNYRAAVEKTRRLRVEMDGAQPVWTLYSPTPKKTMAVLSLLRKLVEPAVRSVTGGEVQILAVERMEP